MSADKHDRDVSAKVVFFVRSRRALTRTRVFRVTEHNSV